MKIYCVTQALKQGINIPTSYSNLEKEI